MLHNTYLDFYIGDTHSCKTIAVVDTSSYNPLHIISEPVLQVIVPGYDDVMELNYYKGGVTVLNSNNISITNHLDPEDYVELPDGAYTIKLSICPHDQFWKEITFYRICKLQCLYDKALLLLDLSTCEICYSKDKKEKLSLAKFYMEAVIANTNDCNVKKANEMYSSASKILTTLINCKDCEE